MPPRRRRPTPPATLTVGTVVDDRFELRERVGGGGMGVVYRAFDRRLKREVALKALLSDVASDHEVRERFEREGEALARMKHPNIVGLHDMLVGDDGRVVLVLELVRGRSLAALLADEAPLRWSRCAEIGIEVCAALSAAHAAGVVHRDIKPSNILIDEDGTVRVADFGVARLADAKRTVVGLSIGTPEYFSPEQAEGRAVSERSDIYSLSVVLFEAATGRLPYSSDEGLRAVAMMHVTAPVPDPCVVEPTLPEPACHLIQEGLQKDPDARFASSRALADALRATRDLPQAARPRRTAAATVITPSDGPPAGERPPAAATVMAAGLGDTGGEATDERGPPSPPTRLATARGGRAALVAAGVLAVVAAVGGFFLGTAGGDDEGSSATATAVRTVRAGSLSVELPRDWRPAPLGSIPDLSLTDETAYAPPDGRGAVLVGTSSGSGPSLLPRAMVSRLSSPPTGEIVEVGGTEALVHRDLTVEGIADPVTVYAIPAADGVVTVACHAPGDASAAVAGACRGALASIGVPPGAFALDPSPEYGRPVARAVDGLTRERAGGLQRLGSADSPAGQAAAARDLSRAYGRTAAALGRVPTGPAREGVNAGIIAALSNGRSAFADMGGAVTREDAAAFAAAGRAVTRADARLREALAELASLGYAPP